MARQNDGFFREILETAERHGWKIERTANRHYKLIPPSKDARIVVTSGTPSDQRATKNFLSDLRKSGLDV